VRTKTARNDVQSGQVVRILATDAAGIRDFQAFAKQTGHELAGQGEQDRVGKPSVPSQAARVA